MSTLRIFISSPGDVAEERDKAKQVVAALQRQCEEATLVSVLWENLAIPATASFQEGIDFVLAERHRIDIAVFILWSRLGSPLGNAITKRDGSPYRSGTEREFDMMLAAFEQSGRKMPIILAYTRDDSEGFNERLDARTQGEDALEELLRQRRLVKQFIQERFHDEQGRNLRAYHTYREPVGFAQRLHTHLRSVVDELLGLDHSGATWSEAPYRSLEVFDIRHAPIFCGRDEETCEVLQRLRDQHAAGCAFVGIVGASGSGKSSLARAGAAATLLQRSFDEGVKEWRAAVFIPGQAPGELFLGFARCLSEPLPALREGIGGLEKLARCFEDQNHEAAGILIETAMQTASSALGGPLRLLLVLDQMEELWTDRSITPEQREKFLSTVEALARGGRVSVLATLRSDFYSQAQLSEAFLRMKAERGHFDLTPPGPAALQQLIVQPARRAGLSFERDPATGRSLAQRILEDAARDPSALPLLQYALAELHERRDEPRRLLTFAAYDTMGGVEGALGQRAGQTFDQLPSDAQAALEELLPLLISVDIAGEQNAVRRRAPLADLTSTPARRELTERLTEARFLTTNDQDGTPIATLAHEALLRRWNRLVAWINANRDLLRMRARIEQYEAMWEESGRDASRLLPAGLALEEGRKLMDSSSQMLGEKVTQFVVRSAEYHDEQQRRATRRRRVAFAVLSVLTVFALVAGFIAYQKSIEATQQRDLAEAKQKEAEDQSSEAEKQRKNVAAKSLALSETLGISYFREGSARLRDNRTACEGLAYLARAVREHQNQASANRLLTFFQQRSVWIIEDAGEVPVPSPDVRPAPQPPRNLKGPEIENEPGKVDLVVRGPQGQIAVSWCEDTESEKGSGHGSGHPGMGLHHFRVWNASGKPLTPWIKADYAADNWVGNISKMTFSPDGRCLAVNVERWREPEYLQVWDIHDGKQIGETLVATGEHPNSQGAAFTFVKFTPSKRVDGEISCTLIAGSSRGDTYWIRLVQGANGESPFSEQIALVSHRTAILAADVLPGTEDLLITGSDDGEVRFTMAGYPAPPRAPALKLGQPVTAIVPAQDGTVWLRSDVRQFRASAIPPFRFGLPVPTVPVLEASVDDGHKVTVFKGARRDETILEKTFAEKISDAVVQSVPPCLRVTAEDGSVQVFRLEKGKLHLAASGRERELTLDPAGHSIKRLLHSSIYDLRLGVRADRIVAATRDFVYQVFDSMTGSAISKTMDEKLLFGRSGTASGIDALLLAPSADVLMTRSTHREPPNLTYFWTTLWDCSTGEPLSDRIISTDEGGGDQLEIGVPFVDDATAFVGEMIVHRAPSEMFVILADLGEALAGMKLSASGELVALPQCRDRITELINRLPALRH